jgi:hypothetical protein
MPKALLFRLFGLGRIPAQVKTQLESEWVVLQDEGIGGSVTYRNFHRPGEYASWSREYYVAALIVTRTRVLALAFSKPIIDVSFADNRFQSLDFALEKADLLRVAFDASLFHADWSGTIEYRFRTSQAQAFLDVLKSRQG